MRDIFKQTTCETFNDPDGDLPSLFAQAVDDVATIDPQARMLAGCLSAGQGIIANAAAAGVTYTGDAAILTNRCMFLLAVERALQARDFAHVKELAGTLARALELTRPHIGKASLVWPACRAEQPPAPDPVQRVEIVGMPPRVTETTVERDALGNIANSTQIERDLAAA